MFVCTSNQKAIGIDTFNRMRYDPRTIHNTFRTTWLQQETEQDRRKKKPPSIRGHSKINTEKHENKNQTSEMSEDVILLILGDAERERYRGRV